MKKTSDKLEILPKIFIIDLFLYLQKHKALIISDLHIGFEESLNNQGIMLPKTNYSALKAKINDAIACIGKANVKKIIINGDLVHSFGKRNRSEKDNINSMIKFLEEYADLIVIRGNHDKGLQYIATNVQELILEDILITHGDAYNPYSKKGNIKTIIIGHEHPALTLSHGVRVEKYKCFLKGKYNKKNLIVMPSTNLLIEGTDILQDKLLSPYLKINIDNFEAFVIEDKIYPFGKIKKLKYNQTK